METKTFKTNLHCGSCIEKVTPFLNAESGIENWKVDTDDEKKPLTVSGHHVDPKKIREAVKKAGFEVYEELSPSPLQSISTQTLREKIKTYFPLILIAAYLIGSTALSGWKTGGFDWTGLMSFFMGGFFLIFSFFKFLDLKGFAESYASYDVIAMRWPGYGCVYPFIELSLGVLYLSDLALVFTNVATLVVMSVSSIGVIKSLMRKQKIKCACLGTAFNLPMSTVTLIEDLLMAGMALLVLTAFHR